MMLGRKYDERERMNYLKTKLKGELRGLNIVLRYLPLDNTAETVSERAKEIEKITGRSYDLNRRLGTLSQSNFSAAYGKAVRYMDRLSRVFRLPKEQDPFVRDMNTL